jgi:hypothetical protein
MQELAHIAFGAFANVFIIFLFAFCGNKKINNKYRFIIN